MSVTVNFTKAVQIVQDLRSFYFNLKTQDTFTELNNNLARLTFLPNGDEKDKLEAQNTDLNTIIVACVAEDDTLKASIEAVDTDDLASLEAIMIKIEQRIEDLDNSY